MDMIQLVILAVVQGLTEFLPVSSSGHLVLLQNWFSTFTGDVFLDVVLHGGTLAAVVVAYWKDIRRLLSFDAPAVQYMVALATATVPAVIVGLIFKDTVTRLFHDPRVAAVCLVVTGLILLSTRLAKDSDGRRRIRGEWHPVAPPLYKAFLIGFAQAMAITPGISRSGSTIAASLWLGLGREEAARFSFLMAVPAIAGALLLETMKGLPTTAATPFGLVLGVLVAFLVGLAAIRLTALLVVQRHFWRFAFYCVPLGLVMFVILD